MNQTCIKIYSLVDPITKEIRYIGKTKLDLSKRLNQHISEAKAVSNKTGRRNNNKRYSWIISLISLGLNPTINLIEICDNENWSERECFWISKYENLTNMTFGGDGGNTNQGKKFGPISDDIKRKISERTKEGMNNAIVKEKCRLGYLKVKHKIFNEDGTLKAETKKKISNTLKRPFKVLNIENNNIINCECVKDASEKLGVSEKKINLLKKGVIILSYKILNEKDIY